MRNYFVILLVILSSACSSTKTDKMVQPKQSEGVPEWFVTEPPKNDKEITVTATDTSREMQFAIDKAMMQARIELANRINVKVESLVKEVLVEDGAGKMKDVQREVERVSKQVTNQHLSSYTREKLVVVREEDGFRAYVMLKINVDQSRRLVDNAAKNKHGKEKMFRELEKSIHEDKGT
jgi:hypothetical protein